VQATADAFYSTRRYTQLDGLVRVFPRRLSARPVQAHLMTSYRDFVSQRFFGLGNASRAGDETFFRHTSYLWGGGLEARAGRRLTLLGEFRRLRAETDPGERRPSSERVFGAADLPGFGLRTRYNVYGGRAVIDLRDRWAFPRVGLRLSLEGWRYDDRDSDRFDFLRLGGQVEAQVPLGNRNRRLAFRLLTFHDSADPGHEVPFYLMETVGGAKTLRGYRETRFRDTRSLLLSVEYRWEVWTYVDFAFFLDAGKVFRDNADFDLRDLHTGYGFGIRGQAPPDLLIGIDFARSREGFRVHIGGGPRF
jgi:hypothetical protein